MHTEESAEVMPTCEDLRENDKRSRKNVQSLKVKCYLSEMKVNRMPQNEKISEFKLYSDEKPY